VSSILRLIPGSPYTQGQAVKFLCKKAWLPKSDRINFAKLR
jgi:hypothetical protein